MQAPEKKLNLNAIRAKLDGKRGEAYFKSLEDVAETPEFQSWIEDEFPNRSSLMEVDRRDFLKVMGASMALAGLAGCRSLVLPNDEAVPYVTAPEDITPGKALWFATAIPHNGSSLGVLVESHEGRPTKIEGNPDHASSKGKTDSFAQAELLNLYDPGRMVFCKKGELESTWEIALRDLRGLVDEHKKNGGKGFAVLTEPITSRALKTQLMGLKAQMPGMQIHQYSAVTSDSAVEGSAIAFGQRLHPVYDLSQADVIVSFDADFMHSMPESVRMTGEFSKRRDPDAGTMNRLYAVESTPSLVGAAADHRFAMKPSEVDATLRALAEANGLAGTAKGKAKPDGEAVKAIQRELDGGKRVVFLAGPSLSADCHALVAGLNAAMNAPAAYRAPLMDQGMSQVESLRGLVKNLVSGEVDVLLILGGNPVFDAPADMNFGEALKKAGLTSIHHTIEFNETSAACSYALPKSHIFEAWGDEVALSGVSTIQQPLIAPIFVTKSHLEFLNALQDRSDAQIDLVKAAYPTNKATWDAWVEKGVTGVVVPASNPAVKPGFQANLKAPKGADGLEISLRPDPTLFDGRFANNAWLQETPKPLTTMTWDNPALISPATADRLDISDGEHVKITSGNIVVEIPALIHIGQADDMVTLNFGNGRKVVGSVGAEAGVNVFPLRTSTSMWLVEGATMVKGDGHTSLATTQNHHSMEGRELLKVRTAEEYMKDGLGESTEEEKLAARGLSMYPDKVMEEADDQWGMTIDLNLCTGCHACVTACQSENNIPVVGKTHVMKGREMHWIRIDRYYKVRDNGEARDIRQVEWVNKEDRKADVLNAGNIETVHQPVACFHCEKAPCEPVCPVAATVHSAEGLNQMVYNRCVGTRYCSNNCPYKVRRYNFLNWTDNQPNFSDANGVVKALGGNTTRPKDNGRQLLRLIQNPNVTVRSRGVMEKCTYCVQRINAARVDAKKRGSRIADGAIVTACQQACPAGAITFGNIADPKSAVSKKRASKRKFDMLPELNTKNRTLYLAKIRNPHPEIEA